MAGLWGKRWVAWGVALVALGSAGRASGAATPEGIEARSYTGQTFRYRVDGEEERPEYRVVRLVYPSPVESSVSQNGTIPAEFYVPRGLQPGGPRRPAVICLHILDGNEELVRLTCAVLAGRGIPAAWFPLPYYGPRGLPEGRRALSANPRLFVEALAQSILDVRRTVDVLATRPEVDPERIGITGFSLGAIVGATAMAQEPRLHRGVLALAGGDLPGIIRTAREMRGVRTLLESLAPEERAVLEKAVAQADPLAHAERLRERAVAGRVLMINAAKDEVIPREATEKLAAALGIGDRVEWLEGLGHYTAVAALPQILQRTVAFFAQDLPPGVAARLPEDTGDTTTGVMRRFLEELLALLGEEPASGKCHLAEVEMSVSPPGGKPLAGKLLFIRGAQRRFRLECAVPQIGEYRLGQGNVPWMASGAGAVLRGSVAAPAQPLDPLACVDPELRVRGRVVLGGIGSLALAPDALAPLVAETGSGLAPGQRAVRLTLGGKAAGTALFTLQADGKTPDSLRLEMKEALVEIRFRRWQVNAPVSPDAFDAPAEGAVVETTADNLVRTFAGLAQLAVSRVPLRFP